MKLKRLLSSNPLLKPQINMLHKLFQQQLLALQTHMYNFAYVLTSNREDASDLLQDTTLKALDNEDKYHDNTNFKGWVFTIMRNIFINNYRRAAKSAVSLDDSDDLYQLNAPDESTYSSPENSYTIIEVQNAVNSFSDSYRIPFSMALAGYRYNEIAKKMHLPVGTIKSRIFYARHKLRNMLKDYLSD